MSYEPGQENYSEFMYAWNGSDQSLPSKTSGSSEVTNYNLTIQVNNLQKNGEATLSGSQVSTNTHSAFWTGDSRSYAGSTSFNMYTIEFANNALLRNAANQDQRVSFHDDMCYAVTDQAILKLEILFRCGGGYTIHPYVRFIGVLVEQ